MLKFSGFHFTKSAILFMVVLGLALVVVDASAQSESEKMEDPSSRANDRVILEENPSLQENISSPLHVAKPSTSAKPAATTIKPQFPTTGTVSDKEIRKNESPSTLSFNIFLYIVDKFKAD
jgi:hypothetical protein